MDNIQNPIYGIDPQFIIEEVDPTLLCFKCHQVPFQPKICENCQEIFCQSCLKTLYFFCQNCQHQERSFLEITEFLKKVYANLRVKCIYGCDEVSPFHSFLDHEKVCNNHPLKLKSLKERDNLSLRLQNLKSNISKLEEKVNLHITRIKASESKKAKNNNQLRMAISTNFNPE